MNRYHEHLRIFLRWEILSLVRCISSLIAPQLVLLSGKLGLGRYTVFLNQSQSKATILQLFRLSHTLLQTHCGRTDGNGRR